MKRKVSCLIKLFDPIVYFAFWLFFSYRMVQTLIFKYGGSFKEWSCLLLGSFIAGFFDRSFFSGYKDALKDLFV